MESGDDLGEIAVRGLAGDGITPVDGDVLVVAQKVVSKAEGRMVRLADVEPSPKAYDLATQTGRDPAVCQLYLDESSEILGVNGRHVITLHRLGFEGTGAGVDMSNAAAGDEPIAVLLPVNPDASARMFRARILDLTGARLAVNEGFSALEWTTDSANTAARKMYEICGAKHLDRVYYRLFDDTLRYAAG